MLFELSPARISARICWSPANDSSPSRTAWMASDPRIFSGPALQIVRRTTPRESRSMPQWGLSICMAPSSPEKDEPQFPDKSLSCQGWLRTGFRKLSGAFPEKTRGANPDPCQIICSISQRLMLKGGCRHYMISNISWDFHAVLQRTQVSDPRADRKEGVGQAPRKGSAWHRCCRSHEGCRPDPWRILCALRFARCLGDRSLHACDGPLDRALAKTVGGNAGRKAPVEDREYLSRPRSPRRSRPWLCGAGAGSGDRPGKRQDAAGIFRPDGADDRYAR